ncbi:unnamed protein product [Brachionus calyciflorus]|uniref:Uncharacterized protein n=1 Tax=Brachionus calyciflorus TaxID=104777 RepID=A0A814NAS3_9BILA|nr:unnamed protein product [Brachionus calyciflorus]
MEFYQMFVLGLTLIQSINCLVYYGNFCDDCDIIGNDIQVLTSSDFDDCWTKCLNNPNCNHLSFLKSNKNCFLKYKSQISLSQAYFKSGLFSAIMDRSKNCTNANDYTPNPLNCTFYYRCLGGYLQTLGCQNNLFFDPVSKTCSQNSTCSYGCTNSKDNVAVLGLQNFSNEYFNCSSKTIQKCTRGFIFDIKEKKCKNENLINNIFTIKKITGSFTLIESVSLKDIFSCCTWCLLDFKCDMVAYDNFLCQKIAFVENNFLINDSLIYIKQK